mmetsp:Transcript_36524/g.62200  ORF Transcript_36524/g.62200 Transcript_36524/m.62200 type:complete len:219 (+) Transcript_36524:790-1446(+)
MSIPEKSMEVRMPNLRSRTLANSATAASVVNMVKRLWRVREARSSGDCMLFVLEGRRRGGMDCRCFPLLSTPCCCPLLLFASLLSAAPLSPPCSSSDSRGKAAFHRLATICILSWSEISVTMTIDMTFLRKNFRSSGVGQMHRFNVANSSLCNNENATWSEFCSATLTSLCNMANSSSSSTNTEFGTPVCPTSCMSAEKIMANDIRGSCPIPNERPPS